MLNIANELDKAIRLLRKVAPNTLYTGSLIKVSRAVNPSNNSVTETSITQDVEIIPDVIKSDEVDSVRYLQTDYKLHIISTKDLNVDFYDEIVVKHNAYPDRRLKILTKTDIVEGSDVLLFTIVAR